MVIAMPHWGPEDMAIPNWLQRNLAQQLVDAGADLAETMDQLFNRRAYSEISLWAAALGVMKLEPALRRDQARVQGTIGLDQALLRQGH